MVMIPFSFLPPKVLVRLSHHLRGPAESLLGLFPYLEMELQQADMDVDQRDYLSMCLTASLFMFLFVGAFLTLFLIRRGQYFLGPLISLIFTSIIFSIQAKYPKVVAHRRIKKLDVDLLSALGTILIHLNSGVPLFETMAIIAQQEFGEVSREFQKAIKQINGGVPQMEALEAMAFRNPSPYFRRALWQLISGMKSGAGINDVMGGVIKNLTEEQIIQIERYGSQLNPFAMFYMMFAVILPALGITFMSVLVSFIGLTDVLIKGIYWAFFVLIMFVQIMFFGVIKTKRPGLLGE